MFLLDHILDIVSYIGSIEMNLSHVITDFSFGPYFPQMTQPLTNTLEIAQDRES